MKKCPEKRLICEAIPQGCCLLNGLFIISDSRHTEKISRDDHQCKNCKANEGKCLQEFAAVSGVFADVNAVVDE